MQNEQDIKARLRKKVGDAAQDIEKLCEERNLVFMGTIGAYEEGLDEKSSQHGLIGQLVKMNAPQSFINNMLEAAAKLNTKIKKDLGE